MLGWRFLDLDLMVTLDRCLLKHWILIPSCLQTVRWPCAAGVSRVYDLGVAKVDGDLGGNVYTSAPTNRELFSPLAPMALSNGQGSFQVNRTR